MQSFVNYYNNERYHESLGKSSVSDLDPEEAKILVKYHALNSEISSSSLGYGKLPVKNLEDDELVSEALLSLEKK